MGKANDRGEKIPCTQVAPQPRAWNILGTKWAIMDKKLTPSHQPAKTWNNYSMTQQQQERKDGTALNP